MKWRDILKANQGNLLPEYLSHLIDYESLKKQLLHDFHSISLSDTILPSQSKPTESRVLGDFASQVEVRLISLGAATKKLLLALDRNINQIGDFYLQQETKLCQLYENEIATSNGICSPATSLAISTEINQLDIFSILCLTGITKLLKKYSEVSGIGPEISDSYLSEITLHSPVLAHHQMDQTSRPIQLIKAKLNTKVIPKSQTQEFLQYMMIPVQGSLSQLWDTPRSESEVILRTSDGILPSASVPLLREGKSLSPWFPLAALLEPQKVLITLSGSHGTDIIAAMLQCLILSQINIHDFSFSRLHHHVTFAVLVQLPESGTQPNFIKSLADTARKWKATLLFDFPESRSLPPSLEDAPYNNRTKYAATVLDFRGLKPAFLHDFTRLLLSYQVSVERMVRLNSTKVDNITSIDYKLSIPHNVNVETFRADLFQLSSQHGTDIALQEANVFRRSKRLVVFDMDSTLIQQEVIDEIARYAGVVQQVASITEMAMRGEIKFADSLRRRVSFLKGTPVSVLDEVRKIITFNPGAKELCRCLKRLGFKLAVISGGFVPLANYVKAELGLDYAFANQLKVSPDGLLTGEISGPIVTGERKAELLETIAQAEGISCDQVIAVGDGANDLWMLAIAGLGIAFKAKPKVQEQAKTRLNQNSLTAVLYLLGYSDDEVATLMNS
jgi:phosphoserine phosphatase SerB